MNASNLISQEKPTADRKAYEPSMEEILASIRRIIADDQASPGKNPARMPEMGTQDDSVVARLAEMTPVAAPPVPYNRAEAAPPRPEPLQFAPLRLEPLQAEPPKTEPSYFEEHFSDEAPVPPPQPARVAKMTGIAVEGRMQSEAVWRDPVEQKNASSQRPIEAPANASLSVAMLADDGRALSNGSKPRQEALKDALKPEPPAAQKIDGPLVSPATDQAVAAAFNTLVASRFLPTDETLAEMARDMIRPMLKTWLDDNLPIMVERLVRAEIERVARGGR
jgi:cell pole-organizing protein PopZ